MRSPHVSVTVNLDRVRENAERIRAQTGVPLIAVIKADAYGLGAAAVADALAGVADEFAYFYLDEAGPVGRPGIALCPPTAGPEAYRAARVRPEIATREDAARFRGIPVMVNVDTGMQRFGCRPEEALEIASAAGSSELYTHASSLESVERLAAACAAERGRLRLHAAATSLLAEPRAWLDAVRPGYALYAGALRVTARLVAVNRLNGRAGYTGFECERAGIILAGYSNRLARAPVWLNGRRQRVLEAGMNTAFVSIDAGDRVGDEVVLLGGELGEPEVAAELGVRPHEVLCRYASMGPRNYTGRRAEGGVHSLYPA